MKPERTSEAARRRMSAAKQAAIATDDTRLRTQLRERADDLNEAREGEGYRYLAKAGSCRD